MKATVNDRLVAQPADSVIVSIEGNSYFPPDSVVPDVLRPSATQYTCPWKGKAQYWDVATPGDLAADGAWSYPQPNAAAKKRVAHDFSGLWRSISTR